MLCACVAIVSELLQVFFLPCVRARENRPANRTTLGALWCLSGSSLGALWELSGSSPGALERAFRERRWGPPAHSMTTPKTAPENGALLLSHTPDTDFRIPFPWFTVHKHVHFYDLENHVLLCRFTRRTTTCSFKNHTRDSTKNCTFSGYQHIVLLFCFTGAKKPFPRQI